MAIPTIGDSSTPAFGGFSFGNPASTATASTFSSPFGTGAGSALGGTSNTGFSFGAPTTTAPSLFGNTAFSTPSSTFSFGQPTATTTTGFSFGGFGATATTNPQLNFSTGVGGGALTSGFLAPTAPATVGLGGVDLQATNISGPENASKKDKAVKETFIPNEIFVTVEAFKKFTNDQKTVREEMSRMSSKDAFKVQSRVSTLKQQLSVVSNGVQRNVKLTAKLKLDTLEETKNVEIIQRTKETPPALQYENIGPSMYFHKLVIHFENQMQMYRQQIEQLERHLGSLSQPLALTPNELAFVLKRLLDAFVTLAAQLQVVHQQVQHQKEISVNTLDLNQTAISNFFPPRENKNSEIPKIVSLLTSKKTGPTPTGPNSVLLSSPLSTSLHTRVQQQQLRDLIGGDSSILQKTNTSFGIQSPNLNPLGQSAGLSFGSPSLSVGGSFLSDTSQTAFGVSNQKPFTLQKPPSGNKRNKRWTSN